MAIGYGHNRGIGLNVSVGLLRVGQNDMSLGGTPFIIIVFIIVLLVVVVVAVVVVFTIRSHYTKQRKQLAQNRDTHLRDMEDKIKREARDTFTELITDMNEV